MKPIKYSQKDPTWAKVPYAVKGETATIGSAGCGPTCAAMVIATLTGKHITPVDTCSWSLAHGYKAKNQGTYYSYFVPQMEAYGIHCEKLNGGSLYGKPDSPVHDRVLKELKKGNMIIACMGKGMWTTSGHFILCYGVERGDKISINDPASVAYEREHGAPSVFFRQVKHYWLIDCCAKEENMNKQEAKDILKAKAGLSDTTITFLDSYRYGDDLILKLAKAMK